MPEQKVEDKYRLTLLQIEKRFVDLEVGLGEIKDKLKDVNPELLTSMDNRMEDIEDLAMVENAAATELKKMLEGMSQQFGSLPKAVEEIPKLQEKLGTLEKEINELSAKPAGIEVEERVKKLEADMSAIQVKPQGLPEVEDAQKRITEMSQRMANLRMEYEEAVRNIEARLKEAMNSVSGAPVADLDFIDSRMQSLRTAVDMMSDKKVETDLKIAGLEEKIILLDQKLREAVSQKFVDEIKAHKRDIMAVAIRIESVERVIKELSAEMQQTEKDIRKFDDFEKLVLLNKQVEDKLERFKFIEDQTSRLSSRIEIIYDDLNKNFAGSKNLDRRLDTFGQNINNMTKDLERVKVDINQVARRGELHDFNKKFDSKYNELDKKVREITNKPIQFDDRIVNDLRNSLNQTVKVVSEMQDKVNRLNKEVPAIFVEKSEIKNVVYGMRDRVNSLDSRMRELNQILGNAKPENIQKTAEAADKLNELTQRMSSLENKLEELRVTTPDIADMIPQTGYMDEQISELLGKLIFLETRIAAIEKSFSDRPGMQPIILE
ncbi:MAG: hypothetical protein V1944_01565 [Candidatus Aenigmatarchaeota archaeon]